MQETPHKGADTREHILDVAEASVLDKGFAGTSIEEVIAAVGITKSGFFYHFKDKNKLAKALLVRYVEREDALFDELFARADELNDDPLHGFLVGLRMMSELMADLPNGHPGCLRRLLLLSGSPLRQRGACDQRVRGAQLAKKVSAAPGPDRGALSSPCRGRPRRPCRHALRHRRWWDHPFQGDQGQAGARQTDAALPRFHQGGLPRRSLILGSS